MSLSCVHQYSNSGVTWFALNGKLYTSSKNNLDSFGNSYIGYRNLGLLTAFERDYLASNTESFKCPRGLTLEKKVVAAYKNEVGLEELQRGSKVVVHQVRQKSFPSLLEESLQGMGRAHGYIGHDGAVFGLRKGGSFVVKNEWYSVEELGSTHKLHMSHSQRVRSWIRSHPSFFPKQKQQSSVRVSRDGNQYLVLTSLEPFAMKTHQGVYGFDACTIGFTFQKMGDYVVRTSEPHIVSPDDYEHPFRKELNAICFDGDDRWEAAGVQLERKIPLEQAAQKMGWVAAETTRVLRRGYTRKTVPITRIENYTYRKKSQEQFLADGVVVYE